ncbi:class I SAM-dependent methyltransferase [Candidatus Saccharibacteria bacterium]|nr:class I SAM-dependent methyltransferase [Candidatus Saccharibacteria bacterium]
MGDISPSAKRQSVRKIYNQIAKQYAKDFGCKISDKKVIGKFIAELKPNSKVLDLGAGIGNFANYLSEKGFDCVCYDFSEEMMRESRKLYPDLEYILDDAVNIRNHFNHQSMDGIVALYSLFHIPRQDLDKLFSELNYILKIGGVFCLIIYSGGESDDFVDEPYLNEEGKKALYFNYFELEEILQLLDQNNFKVISKIIKPISRWRLASKKDSVDALAGKNTTKISIIAQKNK